MITIISPAKSMDFTSEVPANISATKIQFGQESESLLEILQSKTTLEIKKIMKVSDKIAELNYDRLQNFSNLPEREALFAYSGDVYNNMDKASFNTQDLNFAAQNLRIISGFYGILRPFDRIKPYRLEMVTKLPKLAKKGLAYYWQDIVSDNLNQEILKHDSKNIINLASNEYSNVLIPKKISAKIINIHFREIRDGVIKNIALNAKRARG
ncbi:MAG: YaaA family protein, partial [Rickettsiaceae bacterium]|nr:YaaA family protein [Rickettsiaceae bacterium]